MSTGNGAPQPEKTGAEGSEENRVIPFPEAPRSYEALEAENASLKQELEILRTESADRIQRLEDAVNLLTGKVKELTELTDLLKNPKTPEQIVNELSTNISPQAETQPAPVAPEATPTPPPADQELKDGADVIEAEEGVDEAYPKGEGPEGPEGPRRPSAWHKWKAGLLKGAVAAVAAFGLWYAYKNLSEDHKDLPTSNKAVAAAKADEDQNMKAFAHANGMFSPSVTLAGIDNSSEAFKDSTRKLVYGKLVENAVARGYDGGLVDDAQEWESTWSKLTQEQKAANKEFLGAAHIKANADYAKKITDAHDKEMDDAHTAIGKHGAITGIDNPAVFTDSASKKAYGTRINNAVIEGEDDEAVSVSNEYQDKVMTGPSKSSQIELKKHYGKNYLKKNSQEAIETQALHTKKADAFHSAYGAWYSFTGMSNEDVFKDSPLKKAAMLRILGQTKAGNPAEQMTLAREARKTWSMLSEDQRVDMYKEYGNGDKTKGKKEIHKVLAMADQFVAGHKN